MVQNLPFARLPQDCYRAPMSVIPIDYRDPLEAFAPWSGDMWAILLDSPADDPVRGRYAYVAANPAKTVVSVDGATLIDGVKTEQDPFTALAAALAQSPPPLEEPCPVPFQGGAVGFLGYELGRHLERAPARHPLPAGQPEMAMGLYDAVLAFDRVDRKAWAIGRGSHGQAKAKAMAKRVCNAPSLGPLPPCPLISWRPELERGVYLDRVQRIIEYIRAGDIFQANFTIRFLADRPHGLDDFAVYRRLRAVNPAPFAAFVKVPGLTLASASPERFMQIKPGGAMETRPIKGTRKRSGDPDADTASARELTSSIKDRAENLMIVDLLRNDIGRVASIGSVKVPVLSGLESFASVHHLVSVITGTLRPGLGPVNLLRASFPGGSITGAPKVRAMEIIDELEAAPRGAYCGSVAWIGYDGTMDSNIVIRSLVLTGNQIIAQAGGGIVSDSIPEAEWDEVMTKVSPALKSLGEP